MACTVLPIRFDTNIINAEITSRQIICNSANPISNSKTDTPFGTNSNPFKLDADVNRLSIP